MYYMNNFINNETFMHTNFGFLLLLNRSFWNLHISCKIKINTSCSCNISSIIMYTIRPTIKMQSLISNSYTNALGILMSDDFAAKEKVHFDFWNIIVLQTPKEFGMSILAFGMQIILLKKINFWSLWTPFWQVQELAILTIWISFIKFHKSGFRWF